ncbi:MAG TPA: hypothetical protein VKY74_03805 [Chloroflexia bacterium]|nr:hypothetical protein [Chloroflexia bacterium]
MESPTGSWLADLIRGHQDLLAAELATAARREIPWYAALPPAEVEARFQAFYTAFAAACAAGDVAPLRAYLESAVADRMQQGLGAQNLIGLAMISRGGVRGLIEAERAADPERADQAVRQIKALLTAIRLILSEINLRQLIRPPGPPE